MNAAKLLLFLALLAFAQGPLGVQPVLGQVSSQSSTSSSGSGQASASGFASTSDGSTSQFQSSNSQSGPGQQQTSTTSGTIFSPTLPGTTTEPATTRPATTKSATTKSATTKPATAIPSSTKPATTKPATTKPATTKPATTKPATTKPATTKPATTRPATTKHVTARPGTGRCPRGSVLAKPGKPPSAKFCQNPPVVSDLNVTSYASGLYYNLYFSQSARGFSSRRCVTANYTLLSNGTVDVLNCNALKPGKVKPACVRGFATRRPDARTDSQLQVQFPGAPTGSGNPGRYNVAAVLGSPKAGYTAAAVYQCGSIGRRAPLGPGFYIISRSLKNPERTLEKLKEQLRCKGYDTSVAFDPIDHTNCQYFFERPGFDVVLSANTT